MKETRVSVTNLHQKSTPSSLEEGIPKSVQVGGIDRPLCPEDYSTRSSSGEVRRFLEKDRLKKQMFQRVSYYFLSGAILLVMMLVVARNMNPPDSALRGKEMAVLLMPWDGEWEGEELLISSSGEILATFTTTRHYQSHSASQQSESFKRTSEDGTIIEEFWVNKVADDSTLFSQPNTNKENIPDYQGVFHHGMLVWSRQTEYGKVVRRTWITANILNTEEWHYPGTSKEEPYSIVGTYTRKTEK